MELLEALFLAIIQGVTEWLPISSSGHLAMVQNLLGLEVPLIFDLFLHVGTLLAVCIVYRRFLCSMLSSIVKGDLKSAEGKEAVYLVVAMIPTAFIGFAFKPFFESMFQDNLLIGISLIYTGILLFSTSLVKHGAGGLNFRSVFVIGIFQGLAVAPGVSRSGSTISAGLLQKVKSSDCARFSFLLSIPAILGATAFELKDAEFVLDGSMITLYVLSAAVSFLVGYASIRFLLKVIQDRKFSYFAYYCWLLGGILVLSGLGVF